jgi:hypothetical protein
MPIDRVEVETWDMWGMLVKTWATGTNCFPMDPYKKKAVPKLPANLTEFKDQCIDFGVVMHIPPRIKGIQFIQANQETLLMRLPDSQMVTDSEQFIAANPAGNYPIPAFYGPNYNPAQLGAADKPFYSQHAKLTAANYLHFHACRIGDYTIAQCG